MMANKGEASSQAASLAPEKGALARHVYERLKQSIFDFVLKPGERYSEQALADALQVSRTPLRLALHLLAHDGFFQNIGGHSAWQVMPLDLGYYEDLYDFRVEIEAIAVRFACSRDLDLEDLRSFWLIPEDQREMTGVKVAEADEAFHRTLVALVGNQAMLKTFDELTERIRVMRRLDFISRERIIAAYEEHAGLLKAIEARDAAEGEQLIRGHINGSREEIRTITLHNYAMASQDGSTRLALGSRPAKG